MTHLAEVASSVVLRGVSLCKTFTLNELSVRALDNVSIELERGKLTAVMGPSGSGKSTLLHVLGGIEQPSSGSVFLDGAHLNELSDYERTVLRRRKLGFIFQSFNLLPSFNVLNNVMMPLRFDGVTFKTAQQRALKSLALVGLEARASQRVSALSGGERQRVAIARAMVIEPQIMLADEPTGNLDSAASKNVVDLLRKMVTDYGYSVLVVTHDPRIGETADRRIEFSDGRIIDDSLVPSLDLRKESQHG